MSPGIYLSAAATDPINTAQAVIDDHLAGSAGYWCLICKTRMPCDPIVEFAAKLNEHYKLPRRVPGATRPYSRPTGQEFAWLGSVRRG
jgi:hypothetical protein